MSQVTQVQGQDTTRTRKVWLVNGLAPGMWSHYPSITVFFSWAKPWEARRVIDYLVAIGYEVQSAIGHESTAQLMSELLFRRVPVNRINVVVGQEDVLVGISIIGRLPEGKVLNIDEIRQLHREGKIRLWIAVFNDDLRDKVISKMMEAEPHCWRQCEWDEERKIPIHGWTECEDGRTYAIDPSQCF